MVNHTLHPPEIPLETALAVADVLSRHQAAFALIGGLAVGYRTEPRATKDADFLVDIAQLRLPGALEELRERGCEFELLTTIREWTQHHMINFHRKQIRVDWLKPVIPLYRHILDRAEPVTWEGQTLRVATAEGLILTKLLAFRLQDQADMEKLVIANRDTLDWPWIQEEWQAIESMDEPRMVWLRGLVEKHVKHA